MVSEVILYIAESLDGYIARAEGGLDWLPAGSEGEDYGYRRFYKSIDGLVVGGRTYEQILEFGDWPYAGKRCLGSGSSLSQADPNIVFTSGKPPQILEEIAANTIDRVWLVGGGRVQ